MKFNTFIKKSNFYFYPIMAFILPFFIRLIPEIIAWPYPIGFDTLMYANVILEGTYLQKNLIELFKSTSLFYIISIAINKILGNVFLTIKILGPILFSILCYMLYLYSKRVLKWEFWKCFMVSLLASIYFVSLRISWEMYRQMLGFIFLIIGLIALRIKNVKLRILIVMLSGFLTTWSHELAAVLFFIIMIIHFFIEKEIRAKAYIFLMVMPAFILFIYQLYNPIIGNIGVPYERIVSFSFIDTAIFISGFLIYILLPILPLIILGAFSLKGIDIWSWLITCLIFSYWPLFLPEYSIILWFRWALLLVYPAIFLSIEGFWKLLNYGRKIVWKFNIGKILALLILLLNLIMSSYYLLSLPENQAWKYFGEWNNYKQFIQTSMLQNSISISDTPSVVEAIKWIDKKIAGNDSVLILHEAIDNWARIFIHKNKIIRINEVNLSSPIRENIEKILIRLSEENIKNGKKVYTIWWIEGKGWYNMLKLPSQFKEIKCFDNIGIFQYTP